MFVLTSKKRSNIFPRRKKKTSKKKDTSYVEYKHYADIKPVSEKIVPFNQKAMKKITRLSRFKKK